MAKDRDLRHRVNRLEEEINELRSLLREQVEYEIKDGSYGIYSGYTPSAPTLLGRIKAVEDHLKIEVEYTEATVKALPKTYTTKKKAK